MQELRKKAAGRCLRTGLLEVDCTDGGIQPADPILIAAVTHDERGSVSTNASPASAQMSGQEDGQTERTRRPALSSRDHNSRCANHPDHWGFSAPAGRLSLS